MPTERAPPRQSNAHQSSDNHDSVLEVSRSDFKKAAQSTAYDSDDEFDVGSMSQFAASQPSRASLPAQHQHGRLSHPSQPIASPSFGQPSILGSKPPPSRPSGVSSVFNPNKRRAEHHTTGKASYPLNMNTNPMYSSNGNVGRPAQTMMYGSNSADALPPVPPSFYAQPTHNAFGPTSVAYPAEPYMSSKDAESAIKDLLEGAMNSEDEDENDAQPGPTNGDKISAEEEADDGPLDAAKMKQGPQEDGSLEGLKVKLLPHQVEGIKWMKQREIGPIKRGSIPKGGILADDMGLGKTVQSISLILCNQKPVQGEKGYKKHFEAIKGGTLVVAPLALIKQWELEIADKTNLKNKGKLKVLVHHGPKRTTNPKELERYDVVITTFGAISSEHEPGAKDNDPKLACHGVRWWRIILDEAHTIKNRNTKGAKACYALSSEYRWCLTGTPLQNNLDELQSLVCFLKVKPYDDLKEWKEGIVNMLKGPRPHLAIRRLHAFLRCIMKRRKKEILKEDGALYPGGKVAMDKANAEAEAEDAEKHGEDGENQEGAKKDGKKKKAVKPMFKTTARNVEDVVVQFTPAEEKYYKNLEAQADKSIEKMMAQGKGANYANALVLLLRLRQACNHPKLVGNKMDSKDKDALGADDKGAKSAVDSLADMMGGMEIGTKECEICLSVLEKKDVEMGRDMCAQCHDDLVWFENEEGEERKKEKEKKREKKKEERRKEKEVRKERRMQSRRVVDSDDEDEDEDESIVEKKDGGRRQRNKRAVMDSDDEEEEGSWLVDGDQRGSLRLGSPDDEDCEGGGDTLLSNDMRSEDEAGSDLSGFVIRDEEASFQGGGPHFSGDEDSDGLPLLQDMMKKNGGRKSTSSPNTRHDSEDDDEFGTASEGSNSGDEEDGSEEDSSITASASDSDISLPNRKGKHEHGPLASAKIRKLLSILNTEAHEHKFIIFSQFTSMLDLIEPFLARHKLKHVRYDGSMNNALREASLHSLRHDPGTRLLLCSLRCGSLGLNLTAATRVVILEPFWNPFVEEQAIDRVHRLTQTIDVTVYKLSVGATVEERILELQDKKRALAESAVDGSQTVGGKGKGKGMGGGKMGLNINELMSLFKSGGDEEGGGVRGYIGGGELREGEADLGGIVRGMKGVTKKKVGMESEVYGRRW